MGRYTDWGKVVARYQAAAGSQDETNMDAAFITGAEDVIDARLASRYTVPFSPVPGVITDLATDLAYVKLRHYHESVQGIADAIEATMKGLLSGAITIPDAEQSTANSAWVSNVYHSPFGVDDPTLWRRDESQLTDEEDARE